MQEMDDDELESEMDAFDNNKLKNDGTATQLENGGDNDGFADHGLSYYHDPHNCVAIVAPFHSSPPPPSPPPPPPLPECEPEFNQVGCDEDGEFMDCVDIDLEDEHVGSFRPPPPPPPPRVETEGDSRNDIDDTTHNDGLAFKAARTDSNFMSEIQLGVPLRRVQVSLKLLLLLLSLPLTKTFVPVASTTMSLRHLRQIRCYSRFWRSNEICGQSIPANPPTIATPHPRLLALELSLVTRSRGS